MQRVLSLIIFSFTMVTLASNPSFASMFVKPKELEKPKAAEPKKPDPKKLIEAQPTLVAVKHCIALSRSITEHFQMVDAFNTQPDLDKLPEDADYATKQKAILYMMGRPDIANFGFMIPEIWKVTPRDLRQKFNSIVTLRLDEKIGFKYGGYPFMGNCKAVMDGEISEDKTGTQFARITMPLAFDVLETKLTYMMKKEKNYNWQIDDLLVNDVGITNYIKKDLSESVHKKGLPQTIKDICHSSNFSTLECDK